MTTALQDYQIVEGKLVRFFKHDKYNRTAIVLSFKEVDELTGLERFVQKFYLLLNEVYLHDFVGKDVAIKTVKSPKLGFDICCGITLKGGVVA